MTETLPGTDPLSLPARPWRTVYLVTDAFDEVNVTRRLAALESAQCVVVRPNPVRSASDLVWDVLTAAGKNPAAARTNRLTIDSAWAAAAAWLNAARTTHIVVERGHRLSEKEAVRLAELADTVDATLWLIWSSPRDATKMGNALESLGHSRLHGRRGKLPSGGPNRPLRVIYLDDFYRLLPLPDPATSLAPNPDENPDPDDDWPTLPDADFPLFLAVCRRRLPADTFDQLNHVYRSEAQRTDQFVRRHPHALTAPRSGDFARALNAYLRDERIGPAASPRLALIRLRAESLHWDIDRTIEALDHAWAAPSLGGPYALRRVAPAHFTLAPRMDVLTDEQMNAIHPGNHSATWRNPNGTHRRPLQRDVLSDLDATVLYQAWHDGSVYPVADAERLAAAAGLDTQRSPHGGHRPGVPTRRHRPPGVGHRPRLQCHGDPGEHRPRRDAGLVTTPGADGTAAPRRSPSRSPSGAPGPGCRAGRRADGPAPAGRPRPCRPARRPGRRDRRP
ncbi:hypothetical protein ACIPY6_38440 [Streptomyces sp. NPDC090054]|uniref:hypothetical protein n=1 Tax=Streptomyces sp. NPDC090054 TaxID=3365933 RepID=UPI0037F7F64B